MDSLRNKIRTIPDFPEPGILYRDITPLVRDPTALRLAVHQLIHPFIGEELTAVVGMEARGFIFGSLAAWELGIGFVPLRKPGKLPHEVHSSSYDLEYGNTSLEVHIDALIDQDRVLIVDDALVTALIQAAVGGIGLFIAGVPAAGLLTAVMLLLCLAQLGPVPVLVPAIVWLYWSGEPIWATVLLIISVVVVASDNIIRPYLIRKGADLPLLLIFAGVIGGLVAFGIIGLFIGPVILAVTYTLVKTWVSSTTPAEKEPTSS